MANAGSFKKGQKRPGQGRPKGRLSDTTLTAKECIALAGNELGGYRRLVAWVRLDPTNERVFWGSIYPRLLPVQLSGEGGGPLQLTVTTKDDGL